MAVLGVACQATIMALAITMLLRLAVGSGNENLKSRR